MVGTQYGRNILLLLLLGEKQGGSGGSSGGSGGGGAELYLLQRKSLCVDGRPACHVTQ